MGNRIVGRRSGLFVRGGRQRRETQWLEVEGTNATLTAAGGVLLNSLSTVEKALRPFTVVRSRLVVSLTSDQAAATEDQAGAVGIAIVSDQASAIGVSAVPTPITDAASDMWLLHQMMLAAGSRVNDGQVGKVYEIDSKAMRKVADGEDLVICAEVDPNVSSGIRLITIGRVLIKLH